nr:integrase, catalytic region, zinc finger, CCHC-type, peptidase aspartic, catalytic [Tanacetum cinerariifolium]
MAGLWFRLSRGDRLGFTEIMLGVMLLQEMGELRIELPKRPHNSDYFKEKMLLMKAQEHRVDLDEEQLLFLEGGQTNTFDDDVDEGPTMFMANLSSAAPIYDEVGPSYNSNTLSKVENHDNYLDDINQYNEEREMQHDVQPNDVVDSDTEYTSTSNITLYEHYVQDNEAPVIQRVKGATSTSESKPMSNTKKDRALPTKSALKKVKDHPRNNKLSVKQKNHVDSSIIYKHTVKQVWQPTRKLFATIGNQWKPTGRTLTLGEQSPLYRFSISKVVPVIQPDNVSTSAIVITERLSNTSQKPLTRVYYVEGLGYNLFFVRQFCDLDLEVAFRKHSCYVRDVNGVDLIKGNRGTNLYTLSVEDIMKSSSTAYCRSADLGKLRPTVNTRIFVGYAPNRKGYRIYNKRTQRIMEIVHVQFDELTEPMALVHISTRPEPILLMPAQISLRLIPDYIHAVPYVPPTNKDLEILFQPMFDEYFKPLAGPTLKDNPFAQVNNDPFVNVFAPEPSFDESLFGDVTSTESTQVVHPHNHLGKWSNDHPLDNVINNPSRPDTAMALMTYADADHAGCQDTRRSTLGSAQFLRDKLVIWSSKKQKSTAISTTKAEYIAMFG